MSRMRAPSLRIVPSDWLGPMDVSVAFGSAPRRLEADIGCGKGRFLLARAAQFPDTSFLGLDRMLGRLRKIERAAAQRTLSNIRLLRCDAAYAVCYLLPDASLDTAYVFFPDPWPKARHHAHRLLSEDFLHALHRKLKPDGEVHVATDHLPYFEEVRERFAADAGYAEIVPGFVPSEEERTDFEQIYHGVKPIGRGSWRRVSRESHCIQE